MSSVAQEQASGDPQQDLVQQSLVRHFAEAASTVLSQIAGAALHAQPVALDTATQAATLIRLDIRGALEGACEIALSAAMTVRFAALLTGESLDPDAVISDDLREAAAELMQQICGNAADRLRAAFGSLELKPRLAEREAAEREAATGARQLLRLDRGGEALEFELHILRLASQANAIVATPPPVPHASPSAAPSAAPPRPSLLPKPQAGPPSGRSPARAAVPAIQQSQSRPSSGYRTRREPALWKPANAAQGYPRTMFRLGRRTGPPGGGASRSSHR